MSDLPQQEVNCCVSINELISDNFRSNTTTLVDTIETILFNFPVDPELPEGELPESEVRVATAKLKYDHVNAQVLHAFGELQSSSCSDDCCETAAAAIDAMAKNILASSFKLILNPLISVAYPPPLDTASLNKKYCNVVYKNNLDLLLDNLDCQLQNALDAIIESSCPCEVKDRCVDTDDEDDSDSCDKKKKKKKCKKCPGEEWFDGKKKVRN